VWFAEWFKASLGGYVLVFVLSDSKEELLCCENDSLWFFVEAVGYTLFVQDVNRVC